MAPPLPPKRKIGGPLAPPPRRALNLGSLGSPENKAEQSKRAMEKYIFSHPRYQTILSALREGLPVTEIARWFAESGWLTVTEKTFCTYLQTFKSRQFVMIEAGTDPNSLDALIPADRPGINTVNELDRMYRLQLHRISMDYGHERGMGKLLNTTHKEIERATAILELRAKIEGRLGPGAGEGVASAGLDNEARDALRRLQVDEGQRDRMASLTGEFLNAVSPAPRKVKA